MAGRPHQRAIADDLAWQEFAACKGGKVEDYFGSEVKVPIACLRCPVQRECLHYAIANRITDGVWGGKSERELRRMSRQRSRRNIY